MHLPGPVYEREQRFWKKPIKCGLYGLTGDLISWTGISLIVEYTKVSHVAP